jgi:hypothetical protein
MSLVIYLKNGKVMSEVFPPISESARVNTRYDPVPTVEVSSSKSYRVFSDKQIIDTIELTTYTRNGSIKTVVNTAQMIDYLI